MPESRRTDLTSKELVELRKTLSNIEIARREGVSVSAIKRRIKKFQIPQREHKTRPESQRAIQSRRDFELLRQIASDAGIRTSIDAPDESLGLMDRCKLILGKRMSEKKGVGYLLDSRPTSCALIVKAAGLQFGNG